MRRMAIMRGVGFGCRDVGSPVLWFVAYLDENTASLQVLSASQAIDLLKRHSVVDIKDLNDSPCWVDDDGCRSVFVDLCRIKS